MTERAYKQPLDGLEIDDSELRELELLRKYNAAKASRRRDDHSSVYSQDRQPISGRWDEPVQAIDEFDYEPQAPPIPKPSEWGASPVVDTPVTPEYYSAPVAKEKIRLPSRNAVAYALILSGVTSLGAGHMYTNEIENPYSVVASLPFIGKDDPAKKELLDKLLANCTGENVGDALYRGNVSAESSLIWNVPNADGTISPLLPTRLDPGSDVERHPKAIIENSILTIGACDDGGQPAVNIKGSKVYVDLSRVQSNIMLEREKVHAEGIQKERLDASVAAGAFPQATADALFAEMTNPANVDVAVGNTLHDIGNIITAQDSTYDKQVEEVSKSQIAAKILGELATKSPGITYTVETTNALKDSILIGLQKAETDKLTITDAKVTNAVIAIGPNPVSS